MNDKRSKEFDDFLKRIDASIRIGARTLEPRYTKDFTHVAMNVMLDDNKIEPLCEIPIDLLKEKGIDYTQHAEECKKLWNEKFE